MKMGKGMTLPVFENWTDLNKLAITTRPTIMVSMPLSSSGCWKGYQLYSVLRKKPTRDSFLWVKQRHPVKQKTCAFPATTRSNTSRKEPKTQTISNSGIITPKRGCHQTNQNIPFTNKSNPANQFVVIYSIVFLFFRHCWSFWVPSIFQSTHKF